MKARLSTFAGLLVTGGSSVDGGQNTECASPGNVQIDSTPPNTGAGMFPWDDEFWVL